MGVERPKRCLPARIDRAKPVSTFLETDLGNGCTIAGNTPRILVTCRLDTSSAKKKFRATLHRHGVEIIVPAHDEDSNRGPWPFNQAVHGTVDVSWHPVDGTTDVTPMGIATFDVAGTVASLQSLIANDFVVRWELVMSGRVGMVSGGTGESKQRSSPSKSKPRFCSSDDTTIPKGQSPLLPQTVDCPARAVADILALRASRFLAFDPII